MVTAVRTEVKALAHKPPLRRWRIGPAALPSRPRIIGPPEPNRMNFPVLPSAIRPSGNSNNYWFARSPSRCIVCYRMLSRQHTAAFRAFSASSRKGAEFDSLLQGRGFNAPKVDQNNDHKSPTPATRILDAKFCGTSWVGSRRASANPSRWPQPQLSCDQVPGQ